MMYIESMNDKMVKRYSSDISVRNELRLGSIESLIANLREPKHIRRCLVYDNKRLLKQIITGKRVG